MQISPISKAVLFLLFGQIILWRAPQLRLAAWLVACGFILAWPVSGGELLPPGHRPKPPAVHALTGAKIVVKPGTVLEDATVVLRDGLIEAVGKDLPIPADARIWDRQGHTIYAGFIEVYFDPGAKRPGNSGAGSTSEHASGVTGFFGAPGQEKDPAAAGPGHELGQMTPQMRVAQHYVPDLKALESMRQIGFTAGNAVPTRGILRGTGAFVLFGDAAPNEAVIRADVFHHGTLESESGPRGAYPASLMGIIAAIRQAFLEADHYALDQADYQAKPDQRKRPDYNPSLEALGQVLNRTLPIVIEPGSALMVDRATRLAGEFGFDPIILSNGQDWRRPEFITAARGAFLVPVNFPEAPKLPEEEDWEDVSLDQLRVWDWAPENPAFLRRQGAEIALTTYSLSDRKSFRNNLTAAIDRGLSEEDALAALTTVPAKLCRLEKRLGTVEAGKMANLTVVEGSNYFDETANLSEVWIDGQIFLMEAEASARPRAGDQAGKDPNRSGDGKTQGENKSAKSQPGRTDERREIARKRAAQSPQEGRGPRAEPRAVLIRNATIWTCGAAGKIENGSLLVVDGKISKVGAAPIASERGLPEGDLLVIDGTGKHVTPGLIDAHSHAMILGGVNESTLPSTAMVRISDVVNSETENIFYQLAGGVTMANLLHGSANPIGGQNCVIKLKHGAAPEDLKFQAAPPGIKFALGENVKQSNWGDRNSTRFPQTRMGVPAFFENRFVAAQQYLRAWNEFKTGGGLRPARDLELEAIGEILQGSRWIHCHSYRQDEILAFLRLMEQFGVKVGTLQHVLEGYKVADEIAAHGAGASAFSDWWAYKFEVYDAIPYAGTLMRNRGVLVSFNSDDADLARRLYAEAAKAVKYGGTPEEEALKFVTLNPAQQLRVGERVGSLESGKDGDFVLWNRSPLDSSTVCLETWIEGKKYFDRESAAQRAQARQNERKALIEKAMQLAHSPGAAQSGSSAARAAFFNVALEHRHDGHLRHCDDD